ncbi:shikimate kinase [Georgenia thermotolerans]|uniref:Shikimate kinase n=1 Tax=Georgenia thermotolerans TaxID=527326 RepID=A0A7J5UNQ0_9MICO|nr:shikimate kinase [Georgenia thermotolerans]KAE8763734.1 shikimate kinase [Georgenia thermotolerans]
MTGTPEPAPPATTDPGEPASAPHPAATTASESEPAATTARPGTRPLLVLVGPPGSGKSTVGALVAEWLGVALTDTDALLAERAGRGVGELFVDVGEERFRDLEDAAVAEALTAPGVLALGSGAVEHAAPALARYRADGGTVVFLDVSLAAGMPRVGLNAPRSVTLGSPRALFSSMAAQRRPAYEAVATTMIDTSDRTVEQVAEAVLAALSAAD